MVRRVGDEFTYRLEVTNAGPDDATGVVITDDLDPMIGFVGSDGCTAKGRSVSCDIGELRAKRSWRVEPASASAPSPRRGRPSPTWPRSAPPSRIRTAPTRTPTPSATTTTSGRPTLDRRSRPRRP
ncbi:hypothetical protein ACE2AJ_11630 [Aquihabitans daechungensis]|uniref:hypothetical protein n=1 Tax=Aquihabitans daechungensis TaxID=1052257 RepID=UPI003BA0D3B2